MSLFKMDPGPCPICGAAHTTCTATTSGPPAVTLVSQRAAAAGQVEATPLVGAIDAAPLAGDVEAAALGDGADGRPFSTATYRGQKKRR